MGRRCDGVPPGRIIRTYQCSHGAARSLVEERHLRLQVAFQVPVRFARGDVDGRALCKCRCRCGSFGYRVREGCVR